MLLLFLLLAVLIPLFDLYNYLDSDMRHNNL